MESETERSRETARERETDRWRERERQTYGERERETDQRKRQIMKWHFPFSYMGRQIVA